LLPDLRFYDPNHPIPVLLMVMTKSQTDTSSETGSETSLMSPGLLSPEFFQAVASRPGVYLMKSRQGKILYVGKAKNLRMRLLSYRRVNLKDSPKTVLLLSKVAAIETILTNTEKEAFILEAALIKKHRPRFNIDLKDDKSYPRIKVTLGEEWPRVYMTRRRIKDGSRYFGPYTSAGAMRNTLNIINRLFPLRRCRSRNIKKKQRPCLNYQMGRCLAPCSGLVDKKDYRRMVDNVLLILEGKNRELKSHLMTAMQQAAQALEFEKAAIARDQLQALTKTLEKQIVVSNLDRDQDVFGYVRQGAGVGLSVVNIRQGAVCGQQVFFLLDPIGDDSEVMEEAMRQYYLREQSIPDELLLPFYPVDPASMLEWLGEIRDKNVRLRMPKRGEGLKLLHLAEKNARQIHIDQENREKSWQELSLNLQKKLQLKSPPARIECLDISNIGGKQPVGSIVCYQDGEKEPKGYRHYSVRGTPEPDDYRMMNEVLSRRFSGNGPPEILPDLLVIDGGKGQLNVAREVLAAAGIQERVEIVSIAKGREEKSDKIYRPGRKNPIKLVHHSPVLFFLMQVRDEAHRFGIAFHRRLRHKSTFASELDAIHGIGPSRKKLLLKTFGSLAAVKKATQEELAAVPGLGPELAGQVWNHFHK